jgi:hypothetical protein
MRSDEKWKVKWKEREMIKYSIAHEICESNLEWNFDKRQNREIIEFVEVDFSEFFTKFW